MQNNYAWACKTSLGFLFQFNSHFETVVSTDTNGMLEYWTGPKHDYKFPRNIGWEFKTDTDLYEFAKVTW